MRLAPAAVVLAIAGLVLFAPGAAAEEAGAQVSACGSYNYEDNDGNRDHLTLTVKADPAEPDADVILDLPSQDNVASSGEALAQDVANGEDGNDDDGVPDPFDGNGFLHVGVHGLDGDEQAGVGTDDADSGWDTTCTP